MTKKRTIIFHLETTYSRHLPISLFLPYIIFCTSFYLTFISELKFSFAQIFLELTILLILLCLFFDPYSLSFINNP